VACQVFCAQHEPGCSVQPVTQPVAGTGELRERAHP
jgi:hypothetical protein